jgi:endonuclease YncB( thermonuclease family)
MPKWSNAFFTVALLLALTSPSLAGTTIVKRASVIDSGTLDVQGRRVRLSGVDAPESGQFCERGGKSYCCGQESGLTLADAIGGKKKELGSSPQA